MEALSVVLRSLHLRSAILSRAALAAPFAVRSAGIRQRMLFHGVVSGSAVVRREADGASARLLAGDVVVLPRGDAHVVASELDVQPRPMSSLPMRETPTVPVLEWGTRIDTSLVCGTFELDHPAATSFIALLPGLLVGRGQVEPRRAWAKATLSLIDHELGIEGVTAQVTALANGLLVHALADTARSSSVTGGLLAAATDEQIGRALAAIHEGGRESVAELATIAGMSRTRFFARFSELVGEPPARYMTRWRVHAAADLLGRRSLSMAEIAEAVGYSSEDALARVFKRQLGVTLGEYRRTLARH